MTVSDTLVRQPLLRHLVSQTVELLKRHGIYFFLLQLPMVSVLLERFLNPDNTSSLAQKLLFIVPFLFLAVVSSFICSAATVASFAEIRAGLAPDWRKAYGRIWARGPLILGAVALMAVLICAGILALVVPALYFMVIYQFVPHIIMTDEGERASLMVYFHRAKRLARGHFWPIAGLIALELVFGIGLDLGEQFFDQWWLTAIGNLSINAVFNVTLAVFFFRLRSTETTL